MKVLHVYLPAVFVILLFDSPIASAQVDQGTRWREAVVTDLDVDFDNTGFHARWRYHRCDCGDLLIKAEQVAPDSVLAGELMIVDGKVLLSRGFDGQDEDIEALIQAPSLMLQLANSLLNRSQPKGPFVVNEKQSWDETEKTLDLQVSTGFATGRFDAPWGVKGSGWRTGPGHVRFNLVFQFASPNPGQTGSSSSITFNGDLDFAKQAFPYPESTVLDGWRIQWVSKNDPQSKPVSDGLTLKSLRKKANDS